jgi:hypothetical protein
VRAGPAFDMTIGVSGMGGTYDPHDRLTYAILGADWALRFGRTAIRMEYLVRRQQMDVTNPDMFKYALAPGDGDFFVKHGAYVELEQPIVESFDLLARADMLYRTGNVPESAVGSGSDTVVGSPLTSQSYVVRGTLALAYAIERNFRLKGAVELWDFSYADSAGREISPGFHLGAVGSF